MQVPLSSSSVGGCPFCICSLALLYVWIPSRRANATPSRPVATIRRKSQRKPISIPAQMKNVISIAGNKIKRKSNAFFIHNAPLVQNNSSVPQPYKMKKGEGLIPSPSFLYLIEHLHGRRKYHLWLHQLLLVHHWKFLLLLPLHQLRLGYQGLSRQPLRGMSNRLLLQ